MSKLKVFAGIGTGTLGLIVSATAIYGGIVTYNNQNKIEELEQKLEVAESRILQNERAVGWTDGIQQYVVLGEVSEEGLQKLVDDFVAEMEQAIEPLRSLGIDPQPWKYKAGFDPYRPSIDEDPIGYSVWFTEPRELRSLWWDFDIIVPRAGDVARAAYEDYLDNLEPGVYTMVWGINLFQPQESHQNVIDVLGEAAINRDDTMYIFRNSDYPYIDSRTGEAREGPITPPATPTQPPIGVKDIN